MLMSGRYVAAAVNFRSSFCRPQESLARMSDFVSRAVSSEPRTRLVVFPEGATTGLPSSAGATLEGKTVNREHDAEMERRFKEIAEPLPGPTTEALGRLARRFGIYIATGFVEATPDRSAIFNSSILVGPDGEVAAVHRKVHTEWIFKAGDSIEVHDTAIGRVGLSICYDLWFPEFLRLQALNGCQVHINMTANQPAFGIGSTHIPIARAAENGVYLVSANRVGDDRAEGGLAYMGASSVVAPSGEVLAMAGGEKEEIVYAEIELDRINRTRRFLPTIKDRRTDLYDVVRTNCDPRATLCVERPDPQNGGGEQWGNSVV